MHNTNPYSDKIAAQREGLEEKIAELTAKAKEATADARIAIENEIDTLRAQL